jgi:transposase-like protein
MESEQSAESKLLRLLARARHGSTKRVHYSDDVKREVVAFAAAYGLSCESVATRLGLGVTTVRRWSADDNLSGVVANSGSLRRVEVVEAGSSSELRLVFPSGAHVELSLAQLAKLVEGAP